MLYHLLRHFETISKLFKNIIQLTGSDLVCMNLERDPSYMVTFVRMHCALYALIIYAGRCSLKKFCETEASSYRIPNIFEANPDNK